MKTIEFTSDEIKLILELFNKLSINPTDKGALHVVETIQGIVAKLTTE